MDRRQQRTMTTTCVVWGVSLVLCPAYAREVSQAWHWVFLLDKLWLLGEYGHPVGHDIFQTTHVHKYTYICIHTCPHMHILTQTHTFALTNIICISRKLIKEYVSYSPSKHPYYFFNSFLLLYCPPLTSQVALPL